MHAAIHCHGLSKRYGRSAKFALKDLTLQVNSGEVYGFLGPNGAGKSTTIRTLLNFMEPSEGSATIIGLDIVRDSVQIKRSVGYLAGEVALYPAMTGRQLLRYLSDLQPAKDPTYQAELVKAFEATLDKPIGTLSKGNRQKLGIIQAFMHQPDVLILDEPTSGLDPLMQATFYETIEAAKQRGAAIFLSSHDLSEVRKMCDRIGFIRSGELISEQTIASLQQTAAHSFDITFKDKSPLTALKKLKAAQVQPITDYTVNVIWQGYLTPLLKVLATQHVVNLDKHEINLEQEFLHLYQTEETS